MIARRAALALPAVLAGCKLIDQNTFWPPPKPPPPPPSSLAPPPAPPLVTIAFPTPDVDFRAALTAAVQAARARKPDADFDVVAVAPTAPTVSAQLAGLSRAIDDSRRVGEALTALKVAAERIHMSARTEQGVTVAEVRVFVR